MPHCVERAWAQPWAAVSTQVLQLDKGPELRRAPGWEGSQASDPTAPTPHKVNDRAKISLGGHTRRLPTHRW